ncbi:hypothetical protein GCM10010345_58060 [Streptomyces canarius]|uniref:Uncharacterized protein n=1 Tax=Streptomyces canarius TaxID=285453 RepID=A0ABQ3CZI3_9ACTN|nr:hypothetical protein GCM10010345_58060 [Streptomyces canarius]
MGTDRAVTSGPEPEAGDWWRDHREAAIGDWVVSVGSPSSVRTSTPPGPAKEVPAREPTDRAIGRPVEG